MADDELLVDFEQKLQESIIKSNELCTVREGG